MIILFPSYIYSVRFSSNISYNMFNSRKVYLRANEDLTYSFTQCYETCTERFRAAASGRERHFSVIQHQKSIVAQLFHVIDDLLIWAFIWGIYHIDTSTIYNHLNKTINYILRQFFLSFWTIITLASQQILKSLHEQLLFSFTFFRLPITVIIISDHGSPSAAKIKNFLYRKNYWLNFFMKPLIYLLWSMYNASYKYNA